MNPQDAATSWLESLSLRQSERGRNGRAYRQYRGHSGVAWLFPADPGLYRASLRLYEPYSFGGRLRQLAMQFGLGSNGLCLDKQTLEPLETLLAQALGRESVRSAFFFNHPGPLGKAVVLVLDALGEALAIAKLAQQPAGHAAIENEKRVLETLSGFDDLKTLIPAPLAWLEHGGKEMLLMSLGPRRPSPTAFGQVHRDALLRFQRPFLAHLPFRESTMWLAMNAVWARYDSELPEPWRERYGWAFEVLSRVAEEVVPVSLAHRDFAPWNMRLGRNGLFVFDWETASQGYMVDYDYFHFHFMTSVLLKGRVSVGDVRRWLLSASLEHAPRGGMWTFLAYLLDLGLSYHRAQFMSQKQDDDRVLHYVASLLDALHSGGLDDCLVTVHQ